MILPAVVLLVILSVPLTGGSLARFGDLRLRAVWSALAALGLQLIITVGIIAQGLGGILHLVSYALAALFVIANRSVPGTWVLATGGACNLVAIAANGGVMPASPWALQVAGLAPATDRFVNSGAVPDARLWWLGDVFAIPASWPLANVFSVGDIVLVVGVAIVLHRTCRQPSTPTTSTSLPSRVGT